MRFNLENKLQKPTDPPVNYNDNSYQLQTKELSEKSAQLTELMKSCKKICESLGVPLVIVVPDSVSVVRESDTVQDEDTADEYYESSWQSSGC